MVAAVAGNPNFVGAARFSRYLLLLPQGLLSRFLSRSAGLRHRRVARAPLQRRNALSFHPAKPAPLFSLRRHRLSRHSLVRRDHCLLVSISDRKAFWRRCWVTGLACEHHSAFVLHVVMPFAQAHCWRQY